jgi:hypothetical protein
MIAKLKLSKFDKNEKQGVAWFNKVEEYFEIYSINSDDKKIKYDFMQLEGDAYNWCIWWKKTSFLISWNTFKDDFFKRFKGIKDEDFSIELTRLQQKGNVGKFTCDWETLATRVNGVSTERLIQ